MSRCTVFCKAMMDGLCDRWPISNHPCRKSPVALVGLGEQHS